MKVVNDELGQVEQPKQPQTSEQFNEQLNLEFALIRVRTAALKLMKFKLNVLQEISENHQSEELTEAIKTVTANILKFPA